jgi:hypothetical protein
MSAHPLFVGCSLLAWFLVFGMGGCGRVLFSTVRDSRVMGSLSWWLAAAQVQKRARELAVRRATSTVSFLIGHILTPAHIPYSPLSLPLLSLAHTTDPRNAGNDPMRCVAALLRCGGAQGQGQSIHV